VPPRAIRGGEAGHPGGFVEHYLLLVLYPTDLTQDVQLLLGTLAVVVNGTIYGLLWQKGSAS
jgi:hypothetical protein